MIIGLGVAFTSLAAAAINPWSQTDWSGGSGQTAWSNTDEYDSGTNVNTTVANEVTLAATSNWYNASWKYRKKITFTNNATQSATLTNFPVMVKLTSTNFDFSKAQSAGQDVRFADSDGTTALSYEIEKWDNSGQEAIVWVKVPQVDVSNTDSIYLYYGNAAATDAQSASGVWTNGYSAVYHLKETGSGASGEYIDSTGTNNAQGGGGTASQVPAVTASGKIDGGQSFAGDDYILMPNESNFDYDNTTFTVSGWFKAANSNSVHIVNKNLQASHGGWSVDINSNKIRGLLKDSATGATVAQRLSNSNVGDNTWHHFDVVFTTSTTVAGDNSILVYIDGQPNQQTLTPGSTPYGSVNQPVNIGRRGNNTAYFVGDMDELRFSNTVRSTGWIYAQYLTNTDAFNTFAAEEQRIASSGTLTSSIFDTEQNSNWGALTYAATVPSNTALTVKVRTSSNSDMSGATAFSSCTAVTSGADISNNSCVSDGHRYVQYQLSLTNTDAISTPEFTSFSLVYTQTPSAQTYYFDSVGGNDSNSGTSEGQAWQTRTKFNNTTFNPGDTIRFKRGGVWDGGLIINESGTSGQRITISDYGTGAKPIFRDTTGDQYERAFEVGGDYITIENVHVDDATYAAIEIFQGAQYNIVRYSDFDHVGIGVTIKSDNNTVTENTFADLSMVRNTASPSEDDYGALAVNINATADDDDKVTNTTISYNRVDRAEAPSEDYGTDGGFVEIFGEIDGVYVYGNFIQDSKGFMEIGSDIGTNALTQNVYIYNNISLNNDGKFIFVNGGTYASQIENIVVQNNTIYESISSTSPFYFANGTPGATDLILKNNIMYAKAPFVNCINGCSPTGSFTHTHNIYWRITGTQPGFTLDPTEQKIDASFVNAAGGDLRLRPESVAINAGTNTGYSEDVYRTARPQGATRDIGAYEFSIASAAASLAQYKNDGTTALATGDWYNAANPVLKFSVSSYNPQDSFTPRVEVKTVGTSFNGSGLTTGDTVVASGSAAIATIQLSGLAEGTYHWRASNTNVIGTSAYVSYGGNAESSSDFGIDLTAPTSPTISIDGGAADTSDTGVTLTLSASDALSGMADMIISENSNFSGAVWEAYNTSKNFTLTGGGGTKTVYVKFRDEAGNESSTVSDTITFISPNTAPNVPTSLGPTGVVDGSYSANTTPTFNFTLTDSDGSDTVKFHIQIDDTADFSSPVVDYTSALAAQGARSFTVGQAAGSGSYAAGNASQTLSSGNYYWRVQNIDNGDGQSTYASANSGSIAFKVDVTDPTDPSNLEIPTPVNTPIQATWDAATDAISGIQHYAWRILNSLNVQVANGTTSSLSVVQDLIEGTYTFFVKAVDNLNLDSNEISQAFTVDKTAPDISNVTTADMTSSTLDVTWSTNEAASTRVYYGVGDGGGYALSTTLTDTSTRVTSHETQIDNLVSCATYKYAVESGDAAGNYATSSAQSFTTEGCLGSSTVEDQEQVEATVVSGGTVTLPMSGGSSTTLTAQPNYNEEDAFLQIKQLDTAEVIAAAPEPGSDEAIEGFTFDFSVITSDGEEVTNFDEPIEITMDYSTAVENAYEESSLYIGHWNGSSWDDLGNCSVDTAGNSVTCTTTSFSVFALFGTPAAPTPSPTPSPTPTPENNSGSGSSNSGSSGGGSLAPSGPQTCNDMPPSSAPYLYEVRRYGTQAELYFTPTNPLSEYYVAYGDKADNLIYGFRWDASPTNGAVRVHVNQLDPRKSYTFKVRGGNGCMPGPWSNALTIGVSRIRGWVQFFPNTVKATYVNTLPAAQKKVSTTVKPSQVQSSPLPADQQSAANAPTTVEQPPVPPAASQAPTAPTTQTAPSTTTAPTAQQSNGGFFGWIKGIFGWK